MTTQEIKEQIRQEMRQARINTFCLSHGIDPTTVTYKDGMLCIPFDL